ncbi:DUF2059 domain-containing protein [Phenylobacterium sp.]|jgi:hypothetical protein|uniref:DUF2059 domain-containing protein n=1 Tax=Phenylobacterium sp. TaxID=1871053 RepID=UPI002E300631|nr:DUF2059 domain-containing protein [Phenylobacterium sp.]HEX3366175.1 DUF2059 domain-containing protein [Phenylobacterium sp.]
MPSVRRLVACLAAAGAIAAATPAISADAPPSAHSLELSRQLFAEMHMDQMVGQMMKSMVPAMMAQARKANPSLTDEQAAAMTEAVTESTADMLGKITDKFIPLYASTFTEKELQDVVNFYNSPSGQAVLNKMPVMMSQIGPTMTELMPAMTADVLRRLCSKTDCSKMSAPPRPKT